MKPLNNVVLIMFFLVCLINVAVDADISDVEILPAHPTSSDIISIITSGVESSGGVEISELYFTQDNFDLELTLNLRVGSYQVITPWSYTKEMDSLPTGSYNLTVNALNEYEPSLNDTFLTSFEVVPEPASLTLLALGGIRLIRNN